MDEVDDGADDGAEDDGADDADEGDAGADEGDMDSDEMMENPSSPYQMYVQYQHLANVASYDPFKGQIAMLFLAFGMAAWRGMNAFRYHGWGSNLTAAETANPWYDTWKYDSGTEWVKLSR